jgi:AcrR family transcriptional regulator
MSKKYDAIMDAARRLFYKYGIRKVTIEEICAESSVSKMTFYKYFTNKTELAKAVMTKIFSTNIKDFTDLMESDISFPEKMHGLLMMKIEGTKDANWAFFIDLYKSDDTELTAYMQNMIQDSMKLTAEYFRKAQEKGLMRKDLHPALMMVILDKMQEMAFDERLLKTYDSVQELCMEITKFFLYGIFEEL